MNFVTDCTPARQAKHMDPAKGRTSAPAAFSFCAAALCPIWATMSLQVAAHVRHSLAQRGQLLVIAVLFAFRCAHLASRGACRAADSHQRAGAADQLGRLTTEFWQSIARCKASSISRTRASTSRNNSARSCCTRSCSRRTCRGIFACAPHGASRGALSASSFSGGRKSAVHEPERRHSRSHAPQHLSTVHDPLLMVCTVQLGAPKNSRQVN